jgi:MoaA/NifB/PqqE/SkfB family radical SAM enzyme
LGEMPDIARSLSISSINIVPYYYFPSDIGEKYKTELKKKFNCPAFSWRGFHQENSGIDFNLFKDIYRNYLANLGEIYNFPYMDFTEEDYRIWSHDSQTPVGSLTCMNIEKLFDIQPDGEANFCVDFPDYSIGNVKKAAIKKIWNSPKASRFRTYRRKKPLSICYRCGAKYISEIKE